MVFSSEIRWFFNTRAEATAIENWFNQQGHFFTGEWQRADIYLWRDTLTTHGIKIREGKVEVKILQEDKGITYLDNNNSGCMNTWVKYSFELVESDEEANALLLSFAGSAITGESKDWVKVNKERLLVKYDVENLNNEVVKVAGEEWPDEGCGVEFTKIEVNNRVYFTFGFEAFSKTNQRSQNLTKVLNQFWAEGHHQSLYKSQSYSYPAFLASIFKP